MRAVLFGAGGGGKRLFPDISRKYDVIAFVDNDSQKWGGKLCEVKIYSPIILREQKYDVVIILSLIHI